MQANEFTLKGIKKTIVQVVKSILKLTAPNPDELFQIKEIIFVSDKFHD